MQENEHKNGATWHIVAPVSDFELQKMPNESETELNKFG